MTDHVTAQAVIAAASIGYAFIASFIWTMCRKPARRFHPVRVIRSRGAHR